MNSDNKLSELDGMILRKLYDIPLKSDPVLDMATELGISKMELLNKVHNLLQEGIIHRITPILAHRRVGYVHNVMVLLQTNGKELQQAAEALVKLDFISHLFRRDNPFGFNLYCMIHGRNEQEIKSKLTKIKKICPNVPMIWSESTKEIKKISLGILE